jgi:transmembrane sensor
MTDDPNSEVQVLKRDARRWVTQLISGEATTADAEALKRWRQQSPAHEAAFVDAVHVWKSLGSGGRTFIARRGSPVWPAHRVGVSRRAMLGGATALAASAAAYAVINPPLRLWPSFDELRADYRTGTGEQRHLTVANVAVQMNTRTSIAIPRETNGVDQVRLITGEASFAMPPQSPKSLIVLAGNGRTVASKARFDVRNLGSTVCVTCLEGEVQVEQGAQTTMVPHEHQLSYDEAGLGQALTVDPGEATSWQNGFIVFRSTPLAAVVDEINRYRSGKVILINAALGQKAISGRFRIERADEILGWIERAAGARSRSLPGGIVLLS